MSSCVRRLWGRPRVFQWSAEPHQQCASKPQPRLRPRQRAAQRSVSDHHSTQRRPAGPQLLRCAGQRGQQQPLDRRGRRRAEGPTSETGLQLGHVPQLSAALCLHNSHQGFLPVTDPHPPLRLTPEQKRMTIIMNNNHNNYDVNDNISNQKPFPM